MPVTLKLLADPTFRAKVGIPRAGEPSIDVEMIFRHRTKEALQKWNGDRENRSDLDSFLDMVVGWELTDEFNRENVSLLLENYMGTALATFQVYFSELMGQRIKN